MIHVNKFVMIKRSRVKWDEVGAWSKVKSSLIAITFRTWGKVINYLAKYFFANFSWVWSTPSAYTEYWQARINPASKKKLKSCSDEINNMLPVSTYELLLIQRYHLLCTLSRRSLCLRYSKNNSSDYSICV